MLPSVIDLRLPRCGRVRHPSVPPREAALPSGCGRRHRPVAPIHDLLAFWSISRKKRGDSLSAGVPWS
jgi:hypothetical protein